ncbi:MAG: PDZ domain-containing protein [Chthonomonadales bacterium]|nr:PDZ domain-containing protein [Chthonomonadales bacterium]
MVADIWSRPKARAGMLIAAFLVGCALTGSLLTRPSLAEGAYQARTQTAAISDAALAQRTSGLASLEDGFVAIAQRVLPTVVSIRARRTVQAGGDVPDINDLFRDFFRGPGGEGPEFRQFPRGFRAEGGGSGVVIRPDGWVLTNDHVVGGADKVTVKLEDGREFDGTVRRDYRSDLAVVKIDARDLPVAQFADSDKVRVGQWALAFGAPLALDDTMTLGIISAKKRQQAIAEGTEGRFYPTLLQTDASINPGNSGGPLVDATGRVIGINVAIKSPTGGNVGIGFAIPSNTAKQISDALISKGKVVRGFLGVVPTALTPAQREKYGVKSGGALVETVSENTPAAKAGLQPEDVIVKVNGKDIEDDVDFRNVIAWTNPGETVEIVVRRGGKDVKLTAKLEAAPDLGVADASGPSAGGSKLGIKVERVTPDSARKYNLGDIQRGVVVVQVEAGSPADEAGVQPGDVILRANGREMTAPADLDRALSGVKSGDRIPLVIRRENARTLVTVVAP